MTLRLVGGAVVVSLDPPLLVQADIAIDGGRVTAVVARGQASDPPAGSRLEAPAGSSARDCSGCLIVPGNVCAHTHLYAALSRGMPNRFPPARTFLEILQRLWWRLDRALDDDSIRAAALAAGAEALLAGTTTLVDHHSSPNAIDGSLDIVADALAELGVRSVLCYETTDRDGRDRAHGGIRENARFIARVRRGAYPLARGMIGAHASFTLSDDTLGACVDAATETGCGIHMHAAEDDVDQRDARSRCGRPVIERLARAGALTERSLLAHAIHLEPREAERIRTAACTVAHTPRSNMNNAVGRPPLERLGPHVALGTDGIGADMFEEARVATFRHREDGPLDAAWPLARLAQGSRLAGRAFEEPLLGRIEPGAPADLAVLEYDPPAPLFEDDLGSHWTFGLSAAAVRDVVVGGTLVVADRHLARLDRAALAAEARAQAARLWLRLEDVEPHPFDPEDGFRAAAVARSHRSARRADA